MALFSQRSASQAGSAQIPLSPRGLSSEGTPVPATAGGEMPPDKEVTRQLEDVMNMMSMPQGQRESMRRLSVQMQWDIVQQNRYQQNRDNTDPESCIRAIQEEPGAFTLRRLRVCLFSQPSTWVSNFLQLQGLNALLRTAQQCEMNVISRNDVSSTEQEEIDHEIVQCIKAIMNHRPGLAAVMRTPDVTRELIRYVKSRNARTQRTAMELLACIAIYPPNGHSLVMSALKRFKLIARRNGRFDVLIDVLQYDVLGRTPNPVLGQWVITLINAVVSCNENQSERERYRRELATAGLMKILHKLNQLHNERLDRQIKIYRDSEREDIEAGGSHQANDSDLSDLYYMTYQQLVQSGDDELIQGYVPMLQQMLRFTTSPRGLRAFLAVMRAVKGLTQLSTTADDDTFKYTLESLQQLKVGDVVAGSLDSDLAAFLRCESGDMSADGDGGLQRQLDAARRLILQLRSRIAFLESSRGSFSSPSSALPPFTPMRGSISGPLPPMTGRTPSMLPTFMSPGSPPFTGTSTPLAGCPPPLPPGSFGTQLQITVPPIGGLDIPLPTPRLTPPSTPGAHAAAAAAATTPAAAPLAAVVEHKPDTPAQTPAAAPTVTPAKPTGKASSAVADLFASRAPVKPVEPAPEPVYQPPVFIGGGAGPGKQWGMHETSIPPPIMPEPGSLCNKGPMPPPAEGTYGDDMGFANQSWGMHPSAIPPPIMPEPGSLCNKGPMPPPAQGTYGDLCGSQSWGMHPSAIPPPIMPEPGSLCTPGPMPPPAVGTYGGSGRRGGGRARLPAKPNVKPPVATKRLQWDKIEDKLAAETIWAKIGAHDIEIDQTLLLELFGRQERKPEEKAASDRPKVVSLLSNNASREVAINQNKFKMDLDTMVLELSSGNDELIDMAQLDGLIKLAQNEENPLGAVAAFTGDVATLGKTEQFCAALNRVPDLQKRLEVWLFRRQFCAAVVDLQPDLEVVQLCFLYLHHSAKFRHLLQLTLAVGNYLNGGSRNGGAYGFKLSSLSRLSDTRDSNRQSLLHYMIRMMQRADKSWASGTLDDEGNPREPGEESGSGEPYRDRDPLQADGDYDAVAEVTGGIDALFPQLCLVREMVVFTKAQHISFQNVLNEVYQLQAGFEKARNDTAALAREGVGSEAFFQRMDSFFATETATIEQLVKSCEELVQLFADVSRMYGEDIEKPDDAESLVGLIRQFREDIVSAIRDIDQERVAAEREAARKARAEEQERRREQAKERAVVGRARRRQSEDNTPSDTGELDSLWDTQEAPASRMRRRRARVVEAMTEQTVTEIDAGAEVVPEETREEPERRLSESSLPGDQLTFFPTAGLPSFVPHGKALADLVESNDTSEESDGGGFLDSLMDSLAGGEAFRHKPHMSRRVVHSVVHGQL